MQLEICYAYLHDLPGSSFPVADDDERYPQSNDWPEWFSRGWTLQEMIAPRNVQFFNKDWHPIGDKRMLARTLSTITRVPQYILKKLGEESLLPSARALVLPGECATTQVGMATMLPVRS